jgi:hypothetical protein
MIASNSVGVNHPLVAERPQRLQAWCMRVTMAIAVLLARGSTVSMQNVLRQRRNCESMVQPCSALFRRAMVAKAQQRPKDGRTFGGGIRKRGCVTRTP